MITEENIAKLIQECRASNRSSQQELYKYYYGYVMTICRRYAANGEDSEEMLNDIFFKIFTNLDKYNPDLSFKNWIARISVNACVDFFRRRYKNKPHETELVNQKGTVVDNEAISNIEVAALYRFIDLLSPYLRMVFVLYVVEGYKHEEIANLLSISVSTSKSHLNRARIKLQAMIEQKGKPISING